MSRKPVHPAQALRPLIFIQRGIPIKNRNPADQVEALIFHLARGWAHNNLTELAGYGLYRIFVKHIDKHDSYLYDKVTERKM